MTGHILVAYASRTGSTAEIAEAVAAELRTTGAAVDVREVSTIPSVAGYTAVIIGGPLYMGKVVAGIRKFVDRHAGELCHHPVAIFAVGTAPLSHNPATLDAARRALRSAVAPVTPVAETVFAGRIDPSRLSFLQKKLVSWVKAPVGDFRDWDAIASWARGLPVLLKS